MKGLLIFCVLLAASHVGYAQNNAATVGVIGNEIARKAGATRVTGDAYTQLRASVSAPTVPMDARQSRKLFESILATLGAGKKSRAISLGIRVRIGSTNIPEHTLVTYRLDSDADRMVIVSDSGHTFPFKRLDPNEKIVAEVVFRDVAAASLDAPALSNAVADLIPGTALVSEATRPLIQQVFRIASSAWSSNNTQSTEQSFREELSPYGGDSKEVRIPLRTRGGEYFGTVTLTLLATPTLFRAPMDVFEFDGVITRGPGDSPSMLGSEVGGIKQSYMASLRGLSSYTDMLRERNRASTRNFCGAAREFLISQQGLSVADGTFVTYGVLTQAGFDLTGGDTSWFQDCFSSSETAVMASSNGVVVPTAPAAGADSMPADHLFAFGCWMLSTPGRECSAKAPRPDELLRRVLGENVDMRVDSAFLDMAELGDGTTIMRDSAIGALKGAASAFGCFRKGMLVRSLSGKAFRLESTYRGGQIDQVRVYPVPESTWNCTA